jgi:hypothetical protein
MARQSLLDEAIHGELSEHLLGATDGQVEIPGCEGFVLDLDAAWAEIERFEAH